MGTTQADRPNTNNIAAFNYVLQFQSQTVLVMYCAQETEKYSRNNERINA